MLNSHKTYAGFAIEFKHPLDVGVLKENKRARLEAHAQAGYKTMVSCDYNAIVVELTRYFAEVRVCCTQCNQKSQNAQDALGITSSH